MPSKFNTKDNVENTAPGLCSEIKTPKREALLLSPSALIQIGASPFSKRYNSIRKIDFEHEERKVHASVRKLDFFK